MVSFRYLSRVIRFDLTRLMYRPQWFIHSCYHPNRLNQPSPGRMDRRRTAAPQALSLKPKRDPRRGVVDILAGSRVPHELPREEVGIVGDQ